ncbi:protein archease [Lepeophtheirus salmonis]|uniref:Archease n=1 Tax=Lepeophtheirus salmonis TaxID=72036 RepID=C1BS64_LEPSM|nr:protein archease-like [Lepeophtheirus salmonis]ACO11867.1 archease [Lepeophtheirus salmonis]ADD37991.1 Protein archease [Lepeophtheirus salmonis]
MEQVHATQESDPDRSTVGYEYLDHTADVQIHSWASTLREAIEQSALGLFNYMTDLQKVESKSILVLKADGHDLESLLYNFLDECLYHFHAEEYFVASEIEIIDFDRRPKETESLSITARLIGETFDLSKHTPGTEIKAITYSAMQIHENDSFSQIFVIVDI